MFSAVDPLVMVMDTGGTLEVWAVAGVEAEDAGDLDQGPRVHAKWAAAQGEPAGAPREAPGRDQGLQRADPDQDQPNSYQLRWKLINPSIAEHATILVRTRSQLDLTYRFSIAMVLSCSNNFASNGWFNFQFWTASWDIMLSLSVHSSWEKKCNNKYRCPNF